MGRKAPRDGERYAPVQVKVRPRLTTSSFQRPNLIHNIDENRLLEKIGMKSINDCVKAEAIINAGATSATK